MNKLTTLKTALSLAALLALPVAHAEMMSKVDYKASKTKISTDYKADKAACGSLAANAKDICVEEAKAKEKNAKADLEFSYTGTLKDQNKALTAHAESAYAVAKERCDDKSGNDKDVCVKEAKAIEVKALADIKLVKEIRAAKTDATADKMNADYKVAAEKCESLAGDAKTQCVAAAKMKFGKT